jgi:hypothetical protein
MDGTCSIDATHNAQMGDSQGLMVVTVPREVPIWMAGALSMPLTMRKWVIVEVWWLFQSQGDCQYGWQGQYRCHSQSANG